MGYIIAGQAILRVIQVKIIIKNLQKKIPVYPARIKKSILKVFASESNTVKGEVTFCFVNDSLIRKLNRKYLSKDVATDVLAFDISSINNPKVMIADIIISTDAAIRNSKIFRTKVLAELNRYCVHGVLHLLGYNDSTIKERLAMRKKEDSYVYS